MNEKSPCCLMKTKGMSLRPWTVAAILRVIERTSSAKSISAPDIALYRISEFVKAPSDFVKTMVHVNVHVPKTLVHVPGQVDN